MNTHTPGPWVKTKYKVSTPSGGLIANTRSTGEASCADEANARLIAAAPEMLAALILLTGRYGITFVQDAALRNLAVDAIAKATRGES